MGWVSDKVGDSHWVTECWMGFARKPSSGWNSLNSSAHCDIAQEIPSWSSRHSRRGLFQVSNASCSDPWASASVTGLLKGPAAIIVPALLNRAAPKLRRYTKDSSNCWA